MGPARYAPGPFFLGWLIGCGAHPGHRSYNCCPIARRNPVTFILSHQVLDETLQNHRAKSNDLANIDKLFGGADGYYWYHTLRHLCPKNDVIVWNSEEEMRAAVQGHENETAAEDEVKPQVLKDVHLAAMAKLLALRR